MFYLRSYFSYISKNWGQIFFRGLLLVGLIASLGFYNQVQNYVQKSLKNQKSLPTISALMTTDVNIDWVRRKLINLPGVEAVKAVSQDKIDRSIKKVLGELTEVIQDQKSYHGVQVVFNEEVTVRSQTLVKEYLEKLLEKHEVMIDSPANKNKKVERSIWVQFLSQYGAMSLIGVFAILWGICFLMTKNSLLKKSYLIENFQRRAHVALKLFATELLLVLILITAIVFIFKGAIANTILGLIFVCLVALPFLLGQMKWKNI